jgi:hypothetical protein
LLSGLLLDVHRFVLRFATFAAADTRPDGLPVPVPSDCILAFDRHPAYLVDRRLRECSPLHDAN